MTPTNMVPPRSGTCATRSSHRTYDMARISDASASADHPLMLIGMRGHEGKDFAAVTAPDVRDHEHGSCWIAAIVHRSTDIQNRRRCARRSAEGTGEW